MKKIAILDVDGILLDILPGMEKYMLEKHNFKVLEGHINDWDWDYTLGLPEGNTDEMWEYIWGTPARVYEGANEFIRALKDRGYYVQGLSSRMIFNESAQWHGVNAAHRDFVHLELNDYELEKEKAAWILQHMPEAEFIVEDNPKNAVSIGTHTNLDVYLYTRPWNSGSISVTNVWTRVYNYAGILREIDLKARREKLTNSIAALGV